MYTGQMYSITYTIKELRASRITTVMRNEIVDKKQLEEIHRKAEQILRVDKI